MKLHPKIMAALITSVLAAALAIGNVAAQVYPQWANIILLFLPVIAGFMKASDPPQIPPPPPAP